MRVVFGWHLDGPTYPRTTTGAPSEIDAAVVGPLGLLNILENQLGLGYPEVNNAIRVSQYAARLASIDDGKQFFSASFKQDAWSVAEYLIAARDALITAGWKPSSSTNSPGRLPTFSALETDSSINLSPGYPERFNELFEAIEQHQEVEIDQLTLTTPKEMLPPRWQRFLSRLRSSGVPIVDKNSAPSAPADTDLYKAQNFILDRSQQRMTGDDSIVLIEADDEIQAAESVAAWLAADSTANSEVVLISEHSTSMLDVAGASIGLPRFGLHTNSRFRSALQIFPLCFDLSWAPLNIKALLEFLYLPDSPLPNFAGRILANVLRENPGIGNEDWHNAWTRIKEVRLRKLQEQQAVASDIHEVVETDVASWRSWIECERFNPADGIPEQGIHEICQRISRWSTRKTMVTGDQEYLTVADLALSLQMIVRNLHVKILARPQLERIISALVNTGIRQSTSEAAPWHAVEAPGRVWGPASTVIWWNFTGHGQIQRSFSWTEEELTHLKDTDSEIESDSANLLRTALSWRSPLLNASKQLILVVPRLISGKEEPVHPFWHELNELWSQSATAKGIIRKANELYQTNPIRFCGRTLLREELLLQPLAQPQAELNLSPEFLQPRNVESATSIERLLGCPMSWILRYKGKLKPPPYLSLPLDETLIGIIAHDATDLLFKEKKEWLPEEASQKALTTFDNLVQRGGVQLLRDGKSTELERARKDFSTSIERLIRLINEAKLTVLETELEMSKPFATGQLSGKIDILVENTDGIKQILDLKWTRWPGHRKRSLSEGKAIQLAVYSSLVGDECSGAGFYMLRQGRLYSSQGSEFPTLTHVPGPTLKTTWSSTENAYQQQIDRLGTGAIVIAGIPPEEVAEDQGSSLSIEPPCRICDFDNICGIRRLEVKN